MTIRTEPMTVNVGPQHPSTHGVFRVRITFDGEDIVEVEPVLGYLHRGSEKLAEERNYVQVVTLTDRLDYTSSMINNQAYCLAVEQLLGIEPPPRGKYLRTLTAELQRVASHLIAVGFFAQELGAFGTPLMYTFRSRDRWLLLINLGEVFAGIELRMEVAVQQAVVPAHEVVEREVIGTDDCLRAVPSRQVRGRGRPGAPRRGSGAGRGWRGRRRCDGWCRAACRTRLRAAR